MKQELLTWMMRVGMFLALGTCIIAAFWVIKHPEYDVPIGEFIGGPMFITASCFVILGLILIIVSGTIENKAHRLRREQEKREHEAECLIRNIVLGSKRIGALKDALSCLEGLLRKSETVQNLVNTDVRRGTIVIALNDQQSLILAPSWDEEEEEIPLPDGCASISTTGNMRALTRTERENLQRDPKAGCKVLFENPLSVRRFRLKDIGLVLTRDHDPLNPYPLALDEYPQEDRLSGLASDRVLVAFQLLKEAAGNGRLQMLLGKEVQLFIKAAEHENAIPV
ncbi:hypothetical protein ACFL1U_02270 [Patescibacteria group bacterium]